MTISPTPYCHSSLQSVTLKVCIMVTNFLLMLKEPSVRDVEGHFFLALTLFRVSVCLSHVLFSPPYSPPLYSKTSVADGSIRDREKLVDTLYVIKTKILNLVEV